MEDVNYKILWIDDEHENLSSTKGRAKRNGIQLIPFKSLNSGMEELEKNYPTYDGVLLDAKFFENEKDVNGSEDTLFSIRANDRLSALQSKKKFEVFILTGQAEAYDDPTFKKIFKKVYKKGSDDDIIQLFSDIKLAASNQKDTQIRQEYKRVFEVCTEPYIGEHAGQDILNLLKVFNEINVETHFNTIRKVVEDLLKGFYNNKLLPSEFILPNIALNQSSIFLSGRDQNERTEIAYKKFTHLPETHLPKHIVNILQFILSITQAGSHRSEVDSHANNLGTTYLFKSVLYSLFDLLVWFKMYIDSNPLRENWVELNEPSSELIHGKVINLNPHNGSAFFKPEAIGENLYIPKHLVIKYSLSENMTIYVTEVGEPLNGPTKQVKQLTLLTNSD